MRKLLLTTAAVAAALCLAGCSKKEPVSEIPNTFTDTRDGQTYKTVKIGTQTWIARNLNYQTDSSWCYENNADSCNKYGRLYDWNTAKMVCPAGWKLPDKDDWKRLVTTVEQKAVAVTLTSKALKSKVGWSDYNGKCVDCTDDFGFSALPGGKRYSDGHFAYAGGDGQWWTATEEYNSDRAYSRSLCYNDHIGIEVNLGNKSASLSVRCVADRP